MYSELYFMFVNLPLILLMQEKAGLKENETVTDDVAAQAYVENYGSRLFESADAQDRSGNATLNTVKTYLAASQLFESLSVFGEISEEITERTKYAKFRAALIMKAIKSGEKPPPPEDIDPLDSLPALPPIDTNAPQEPTQPKEERPSTLDFQPSTSSQSESLVSPVAPCAGHTSSSSGAIASNGARISPLSVEKAMKLCKYASSALMYDDVSTAVSNLEQALTLLKTGKLS